MTLPPLNPEQQDAVDYLSSTEDHVFVTGKAGAGKTHVLKWFERTTRKRIAICASTGIAALNVGGSTIHRLVGVGTSLPADAHLDLFKVRAKRGFLNDIDTIVIDEISMVNSDLLDSVDRTLQFIRRNDAPFGGIQIVMFGDPYQLPPVVTSEGKKFYQSYGYRSEWFFDAKVWEDTSFTTIELQTVHRQADDHFKDLLNAVRDGSVSQFELNQLNLVGQRSGKTEDAILLASTNGTVTSYNWSKLKALKGPVRTYNARVNTGYGRDEPADRELLLKPGAHIMMLNNAQNGAWVNGTRGIVRACFADSVSVELEDETVHIVDRFAWVPDGTMPDDYAAAPKYWQLPIKLAWAVTIHKSQGLSLSEIDVELGQYGAFAPGQTYVALSRVTSAEGLYIRTPIQLTDIKVDRNVKRFFASVHA